MICFYVEGSRKLGLGHLSRMIPIYHELSNRGKTVFVFHYGDDLGQAFLDLHQVKYISADKNCQIINKDEYKDALWLVDATNFHTRNFDDLLQKSDRKVLLSPKFDTDRVLSFSHCIIRSDPFRLPIANKRVSREHFSTNRSDYFAFKGTITLGIALTGGFSGNHLNELVSSIINDSVLNLQIKRIRVFIGSNDTFSFQRKTKESYFTEIETISSLNSLWVYAQDIDYFIVGNGIIVDECLMYDMPFCVYTGNSEDKKMKSDSVNKYKYSSDIKKILSFLVEYLVKQKSEKKNGNSILETIEKLMSSSELNES